MYALVKQLTLSVGLHLDPKREHKELSNLPFPVLTLRNLVLCNPYSFFDVKANVKTSFQAHCTLKGLF